VSAAGDGGLQGRRRSGARLASGIGGGDVARRRGLHGGLSFLRSDPWPADRGRPAADLQLRRRTARRKAAARARRRTGDAILKARAACPCLARTLRKGRRRRPRLLAMAASGLARWASVTPKIPSLKKNASNN
jgi:hypothetical protein